MSQMLFFLGMTCGNRVVGYASHLSRPQFVSSSENLYVIDRKLGHPYRIHELDFAEMKWVLRENTGEKYAFFLGKYWKPGDKTGEGKFFHASMWYFFHDFLDANLIHE
uniref:DUF295 domain-containing protein n=1 Tax=Lactuca sativa TaxID=4236 RepID=A0A9R1V0J5_LACSA|nr:hypothetical protein LSAT_V11C700380560 [Lactuca sativa]